MKIKMLKLSEIKDSWLPTRYIEPEVPETIDVISALKEVEEIDKEIAKLKEQVLATIKGLYKID